jgi:histidine ammonia-lyase
MGTNAALIAKKVIENSFEVVAIEIITIIQAIEYLKVQDKVSSKTRTMYDEIRKLVPIFIEDVTMYPYVNKVKNYIMNK